MTTMVEQAATEADLAELKAELMKAMWLQGGIISTLSFVLGGSVLLLRAL